MINYYALWIPSYKEEAPKIQRKKLEEVILQDIPDGDTIRLKGEIDKDSFEIHLQYQINNSEWYHLYFTCTDRQQTDGFIFYSLEMEDDETEKDIVYSRLSENLPKSIYHYFKEFFHTHSLHATGEDSLLPVFHSIRPIEWDNDIIKANVIRPIITAYTDKFDGFHSHGRENLQQCTVAICKNKEVTKNIHTLRELLHDGYKVKREMDYCRFLMERHSTVIDNETRIKLQQSYQDFLNYYTDLDFWYNAYLDTISFSDSKVSKRWGITGGILGLISIVITLSLEYKSQRQQTQDGWSLKSDSLIVIKQDSLNNKMEQLMKLCKPDTYRMNKDDCQK